MQKVIALRFFISAQFGNVEAGQVLEATDYQAKLFKEHGLAKLIKSGVPPESKKAGDREGQNPLDFTPPAGDPLVRGSSLRAGAVLQKKTAKRSMPGAKRGKKKRAKKKPATSQS